jgi:hypothetical protein
MPPLGWAVLAMLIRQPRYQRGERREEKGKREEESLREEKHCAPTQL